MYKQRLSHNLVHLLSQIFTSQLKLHSLYSFKKHNKRLYANATSSIRNNQEKPFATMTKLQRHNFGVFFGMCPFYVYLGLGEMPMDNYVYCAMHKAVMKSSDLSKTESQIQVLEELLCLQLSMKEASIATGKSRKKVLKRYRTHYGIRSGFRNNKILADIYTVISSNPGMFAKIFLS
jgi:hypothetical protein